MKQLILAALFFCSTWASAQSFNYLTVRNSDGTERSVALNQLKITFSDGKMLVTSATEAVEFSLAELSSMFFADEPTAISQIDNGEQRFRIENGQLISTTGENIDGVRVYSLDGRCVKNGQLKKGVYLISTRRGTLKLMAQ